MCIALVEVSCLTAVVIPCDIVSSQGATRESIVAAVLAWGHSLLLHALRWLTVIHGLTWIAATTLRIRILGRWHAVLITLIRVVIVVWWHTTRWRRLLILIPTLRIERVLLRLIVLLVSAAHSLLCRTARTATRHQRTEGQTAIVVSVASLFRVVQLKLCVVLLRTVYVHCGGACCNKIIDNCLRGEWHKLILCAILLHGIAVLASNMLIFDHQAQPAVGLGRALAKSEPGIGRWCHLWQHLTQVDFNILYLYISRNAQKNSRSSCRYAQLFPLVITCPTTRLAGCYTLAMVWNKAHRYSVRDHIGHFVDFDDRTM